MPSLQQVVYFIQHARPSGAPFSEVKHLFSGEFFKIKKIYVLVKCLYSWCIYYRSSRIIELKMRHSCDVILKPRLFKMVFTIYNSQNQKNTIHIW